MPSPHEAVVAALQVALANHTATVLREHDLPVVCPAEGLVNIAPGNPEDVGARLGVGVREWEATVDLEHVVQGADASVRNTAMDALLVETAALVLTDRTLGGVVDWIEVGGVQASDTVPMQGAESLKGAVLPVTLFYETTDNPME